MKQTCEYCGGELEKTAEFCPHCGAPNLNVSPDMMPKTIDEFRAFCLMHKLPLSEMRFFIGEDYREPRAFGIYRDEEGQFVVYKNKADGSRAVRYRGPDEAYAVNELLQRMKQEIIQQRRRNSSRPVNRTPEASKGSSADSRLTEMLRKPFVWVLIVLAVLFVRSALTKKPQDGYYKYQNDYYYSQGSDWYLYDLDTYSWIPTYVDDELRDNYDDYYQSSGYSYAYGTTDFSDSVFYDEDTSSDSWSWDDDSDWDWDDSSDSWDSGSTDWDSDW